MFKKDKNKKLKKLYKNIGYHCVIISIYAKRNKKNPLIIYHQKRMQNYLVMAMALINEKDIENGNSETR